MEVISKANETVLTILKQPKKKDCQYRKMRFCVEQPVEDGVLLYHMLTKEMLLLTREEHENFTQQDYLRSHWFAVPEDTGDKAQADLVKWVLSANRRGTGEITRYTIFPTTDCNARCFYCFELNRSRIPMSRETALKVAAYIKNHCGGKKVSIFWFGGEPLYNQEAMDLISRELQEASVEFTSHITTNAYLFDAAAVEKAKTLWNVKRVQITLDGTEQVYNRIKAYIYKEGSPYQTVLQNLERLLEAGIVVVVRLNMDLKNAQDLLALVDELARRIGSGKNFYIYANHLFHGDEAMADTYTQEEWVLRDEAMDRLERKIEQYGLAPHSGVSKKMKLNFCMADSDNSVTVLPGGEIGLCEHFSETEFIGHIDREGFDSAVVKSWKETVPPIAECAACFYYPNCIMLKKCANRNKCFPQLRQQRLREIHRQMEHEYQMWKEKKVLPDSEENDFC